MSKKFNPCVDHCYVRYGKEYSKECLGHCEYADTVADLRETVKELGDLTSRVAKSADIINTNVQILEDVIHGNKQS